MFHFRMFHLKAILVLRVFHFLFFLILNSIFMKLKPINWFHVQIQCLPGVGSSIFPFIESFQIYLFLYSEADIASDKYFHIAYSYDESDTKELLLLITAPMGVYFECTNIFMLSVCHSYSPQRRPRYVICLLWKKSISAECK